MRFSSVRALPLSLFLLSASTQAQGLTAANPSRTELRSLDEVATVDLAPYDLGALLKEDDQRRDQEIGRAHV